MDPPAGSSLPPALLRSGGEGPAAPRPHPGAARHADALRQPDDPAQQTRANIARDCPGHPQVDSLLLYGVLHLAPRRRCRRCVRSADGGGPTRRGLSFATGFGGEQALLPLGLAEKAAQGWGQAGGGTAGRCLAHPLPAPGSANAPQTGGDR